MKGLLFALLVTLIETRTFSVMVSMCLPHVAKDHKDRSPRQHQIIDPPTPWFDAA